MKANQLIKSALDAGGYQGLFTRICACRSHNLNPTQCLNAKCEAGVLNFHSQSREKFVMGKKSMSDSEIDEVYEMQILED